MTDFFRDRAPDFEKLRAYGFRPEDGGLVYRTALMDGQFELAVRVSPEGEVRDLLTDCAFGEPYALHLVEEAEGEFVGRVREAYARALSEIAEACFVRSGFRGAAADALIAYAREHYGEEPEYLWEKFPHYAVLRRGDNRKWYAAILTVERGKVGMAGEGMAEIADVRADPQEILNLVDGKRIFPGWHMNKKHWIALPLDGSLPQRSSSRGLKRAVRSQARNKEICRILR